jgi:hypothetical protein
MAGRAVELSPRRKDEVVVNDQDMMRRCIEECTRCHQVCEQTLQHCLTMGGVHSEPGHVRLMMDCSQICQTSADFMLRGSDLHTETCRACAVVCERCAEDCERMAEDRMMKECAAECRRCAEICQQMAGVHA